MVSASLQTYQQAQGDLSMINCWLVHNGCIVIPESQQEYIIQMVHDSHYSLSKCHENTQMAVRWPGLCRDLKELTDS